jgi:hypothetical protein
MKKSKSTASFIGTSRRSDLGEAIANAIREAMGSSQGDDALIKWTIKKISGKRGGIAGLNEISVTIAAAKAPRTT